MLAGGHAQTVYFAAGDPVLAALLAAWAAPSRPQPSPLIELPLEQGRAALCFPLDALSGIVTEPPLPIHALAAESVEPPSPIVPSLCYQLENFLPADEHRALLDYILANESRFEPATVDGAALDHRASLVLYDFPEFAARIEARVRQHLPALCRFFGIPEFEPSRVECQLNAHNDGHFYKVHNDNGSPATARRQITCVYYLHRQPRAFTGGALRLYDSKLDNNHYVAADTWRDIEPEDNSAVFFLSRCLHEVRPVQSNDRSFAASRFAVTVWLSA